MKFSLEIVSESEGYNIRRNEYQDGLLIDSDLVLGSCFISHYLLIQDIMQGLEKTINKTLFNKVERIRTFKKYKLVYETVPFREIKFN